MSYQTSMGIMGALLLSACPNTANKTRLPIPCQPSAVISFGDPTQTMRYEFLGGSEDGTRQLIAMNYYGPTSLAPAVKIYVREAGRLTPLLSKGDFDMKESSPAALADLRKRLVEESKPEAARLGVVWGEHQPQPVPWCQNKDGRIYAQTKDEVVVFDLKQRTEPDPTGHGNLRVMTLHAENQETILIAQMNQAHLIKTARVHALYRAGDVWWLVARFGFQKLGTEEPFEFTIISGTKLAQGSHF